MLGGIKAANILRTLHGAVSPSGKHVNGVAVISEIMGSPSPENQAQQLSTFIRSFSNSGAPVYIVSSPSLNTTTPGAQPLDAVEKAAKLLDAIRSKRTPLVHQITNNVVMNQSANATLALGASPIMATAVEEMEDLCKVPGALLVNIGTIEDKLGMLEAGKWANYYRKPGKYKLRFKIKCLYWNVSGIRPCSCWSDRSS